MTDTTAFTQWIIDRGVSQTVLELLISVCIVSTIVSIARYIVGSKTYGIYAPIILAIAYSYTGLKYGMEKYYPTWKIDANHKAVTTGVEGFRKLFGREPLVDKWTFSTNGVTINGFYGIPVIGFGPGNEVLAHAPNEKLPISDLVAASAFYAAYAFLISED